MDGSASRASPLDEFLKAWERLQPMDADVFAKRVLKAVLRNDAIIVVPAWWKTFWYLDRLAPAVSLHLLKVVLKRQREIEATSAT